MHSDEDDDNDPTPLHAQTFGQRHGLTILMAVFGGLFAFVIVLQTAC
jgi:hypothetical protein